MLLVIIADAGLPKAAWLGRLLGRDNPDDLRTFVENATDGESPVPDDSQKIGASERNDGENHLGESNDLDAHAHRQRSVAETVRAARERIGSWQEEVTPSGESLSSVDFGNDGWRQDVQAELDYTAAWPHVGIPPQPRCATRRLTIGWPRRQTDDRV
ncbi:MAG: hypothetical protein R3C10_05895 [Pirellulales bacterium]